MAALASDWLRHFWLPLWNCWTEFNETWQEARSRRLVPSLYFSGGSVNKNGRPGWFLKRWHIVLRCTICGPLGLLFYLSTSTNSDHIIMTHSQILKFIIEGKWRCWSGQMNVLPSKGFRIQTTMFKIAFLCPLWHLVFGSSAYRLYVIPSCLH